MVLQVGGVSNEPNYKRQHRASLLVMLGLFNLQQARTYYTVHGFERLAGGHCRRRNACT